MVSLSTFILNYAPLKDRAAWMKEQLESAGFDDFKFCQRNWNYNTYNYDQDKSNQQGILTNIEFVSRQLSRAEFDLIRKHQDALIDGFSTGSDWVLILEDDALLKSPYNYRDLLEQLKFAPRDADVIIAGGPFDHSICSYRSVDLSFLLANHPATNTSSSIVYKREKIPEIAVMLQNAHVPLDWALNYIYHKLDLHVWHMYPYFFTQNKNFKSSIQ